MDNKMFCFQCEQTALCTGCTGKAGVCGKTADVAKLQDALRPLTHNKLSVNLYSTLYGKLVDNMILPSDYFAKQQVNAIRFYEAANAAVKDGFDVFIVLGKDKDIAAALKKIAGDDNVFIADSVADLKKISEKVNLEQKEPEKE